MLGCWSGARVAAAARRRRSTGGLYRGAQQVTIDGVIFTSRVLRADLSASRFPYIATCGFGWTRCPSQTGLHGDIADAVKAMALAARNYLVALRDRFELSVLPR